MNSLTRIFKDKVGFFPTFTKPTLYHNHMCAFRWRQFWQEHASECPQRDFESARAKQVLDALANNTKANFQPNISSKVQFQRKCLSESRTTYWVLAANTQIWKLFLYLTIVELVNVHHHKNTNKSLDLTPINVL